jgi:hypothetical protein
MNIYIYTYIYIIHVTYALNIMYKNLGNPYENKRGIQTHTRLEPMSLLKHTHTHTHTLNTYIHARTHSHTHTHT